jgi:hypothetical protein
LKKQAILQLPVSHHNDSPNLNREVTPSMKNSRLLEGPGPKSTSSTSTTSLIIALAACVPLAFGIAEAWLEDRWLTLMVTLAALCLLCLFWLISSSGSEVDEEVEE